MATSVTVLVGEAQQWIPDIVAKAKTLKVNAGQEKGADLGPVISKNAKNRILGLLDEGIKEGATLELDGRSIKVAGYEKGNFIGPRFFSGVKPGMKIYTTEIFGPVMVIVGVNTLNEAIELINANPFGNGTGIFTQSGRGGPQIPERNRRRPGRDQRPHPGARALLQLHRFARLETRRPRTLWKAGRAVLHTNQDRHGALVRRRRQKQRREYHHQLEMKIAFIGLGHMGAPMARNLLKAGHSLAVFDLVERNVDALRAAHASGAVQAARSAAAAAAQGELVITMLPSSPHVKAAYLARLGCWPVPAAAYP